MSEAQRIVERLIDAPVRVCMDCEHEKGGIDYSDETKSHGQCRRHFIAFCRAQGLNDAQIQAELAQVSQNAFVPEL